MTASQQAMDELTLDLSEVLAAYAVGEVRAVASAGGTAGKCWRVVAATGEYFLRHRGARTSSREALEFDHALRRHLVARGVPTAEPRKTTSGETWVYAGSRAFELYPFVKGRPFAGRPAELIATAKALAHFHQVTAGFPARGSYHPIPTQFALAAPEVGGSARMDDPELVLAAFEGLARRDPAMGSAAELARRLVRDYPASMYDALPRWLIHGDYHPGNLLYSPSGRVAGIFDLDWACEHTRSHDLADGVYFFCSQRPDRLDGGSIESLSEAAEPDFERAVCFLRTYAEALPLTPAEVRAIPLALRARWLAARLEGSAKVPPERQTWFITRGLEIPLRWVDARSEDLVRAVL